MRETKDLLGITIKIIKKNNKKYCIRLFAILLLFGCSSSNFLYDETTIFKYSNKEFGASGELILKSDNTFEYNSSVGLLVQESKGKWIKQAGNNILIISDSTYKSGFIKVRVLANKALTNKKTIKVIDNKYHEPVAKIEVLIGNQERLVTNEYGIATTSINEFNTLTLGALGGNYSWSFQKTPRKDIEICLVEKDLSKKYFEKEVWSRRGRKLISPDGMVYKRVR